MLIARSAALGHEDRGMAGKQSSNDDDVLADINVTPLVDIMLVLLIIFMLTNEEVSEKMKKAQIDIDLPKAASAQQKPTKPLSIVISQMGTLFLNGAPISEAALWAQIAQMVKENPGIEAILSADRRVLHGTVVRVIDGVRLAGVEKIAVNTKEQEIEQTQ
ncbi:MAG: biopolymer transporter ExbD [Myxococcales bacterium]|nr:biopolymer transporter ExbD [Myxococcales bacterium]